ncbi:MAG: serine/threonine-protein kinase [Verrucomicrobiota bacterium]
MADEPTNPPEIPSHEELNAELPQYEVLQCIGVGGMGGVYKAYQENLDRHVAVKVLARGIGGDEFADHFKSEAQAMARLNQTNIISVYDFGFTTGGWLYFVMEFVDGRTLFELVHDDLIDRKAAVATITQVCGALNYAHEHGVVHRDIKSANILVDGDGHAKVGDFGLAKLYAGEDTKGLGDSSFGTPDYAAPEVIDPDATIDHRADIYSLGALFFELLTGHTPEAGTVPKTDSAFDTVIHKAMAKKPGDRYQSAKEFRKAVEQRWAMIEGGGGSTPSYYTGPKKKKAGNKILMAVAALAVLGAVAAIYLKGGSSGDGSSEVAKTDNPPSKPAEPANTAPPADTTLSGPGEEPADAKKDASLASIFEKSAIDKEASIPAKPPPPKIDPPKEAPPEMVENIQEPPPEEEPPTTVMPPIEDEPLGPTEAEKRMQPTLAQFHGRFESAVIAPYEEEIQELREKYLNALTPLTEGENFSGPDELAKAKYDVKRLQGTASIPQPTTGFEKLDGMRRTFHAARNELVQKRNKSADRYVAALKGLLEELESELTKEGEIEMAVEVREYRSDLKKHVMEHYYPASSGSVPDSAENVETEIESDVGITPNSIEGSVWKRRKPAHFVIKFNADGTFEFNKPNGTSTWTNREWSRREDEILLSADTPDKAGRELVLEFVSDTEILMRNPLNTKGGAFTGHYDLVGEDATSGIQ